MESWLFQHYQLIWYVGFPCALLVAMTLERFFPARVWKYDRLTRGLTNIGLFYFNVVLQRIVFPILPITLAVEMQMSGQGLLNTVALPQTVEVILAFLLLDMMICLHHIALHKVPILWRIHKPHHSDPDFDCTTGLRFHPVEALFTLAISLVTVFLFGLSPYSVLLFNLAHIVSVYFTHLNIHFPAGIDRVLRLVIVTPDMHRVHHSAVKIETDSNYSTLISWWDYLFRTYRPQANKALAEMEIGMANCLESKNLSPIGILLMPFKALPVDHSVKK